MSTTATKPEPKASGGDGASAAAATPPVGPFTLAVDVGGTGVKASVLDAKGQMVKDRVRLETPSECTPELLTQTIEKLTAQLPPFDRISVGFPGVVTNGAVVTAPNLGTDRFRGFDLAGALSKKYGKPAKVLNDADMQGYAAISGKGIEMVLTLGTGFGTALFLNGALAPHLELAHHPFRKGETYEEQVGEEARQRVGNKKWSKRVGRAIEQLRALVNWDKLYLGGGNAKKLKLTLPPDCGLVDNTAGILGGIKLWEAPK